MLPSPTTLQNIRPSVPHPPGRGTALTVRKATSISTSRTLGQPIAFKIRAAGGAPPPSAPAQVGAGSVVRPLAAAMHRPFAPAPRSAGLTLGLPRAPATAVAELTAGPANLPLPAAAPAGAPAGRSAPQGFWSPHAKAARFQICTEVADIVFAPALARQQNGAITTAHEDGLRQRYIPAARLAAVLPAGAVATICGITTQNLELHNKPREVLERVLHFLAEFGPSTLSGALGALARLAAFVSARCGRCWFFFFAVPAGDGP